MRAKRPTHEALGAQCDYQLRVWRKRMTWWIPLIFLIGLAVSLLGLIASASALQGRRGLPSLLVFAVFTAFFGLICLQWLLAPLLIRPRVVPYFRQPLGDYFGATSAAFARGRALVREMSGLDRLAAELGVTPLSAFGFAYDYYDQPVQWQAARVGLATTTALRKAIEARPDTRPDLIQDLNALGSVLRIAADRNVDFSLVARLHAKDSLQGVMTRETREGSFW